MCIYIYIHIYMIYVSGQKWFTTQRVLKSHRSKMNIIYKSYTMLVPMNQRVLNKQNKEHNIVLSEHSLVLAICITYIWYVYNICIYIIYIYNIYIYIIYNLCNLSKFRREAFFSLSKIKWMVKYSKAWSSPTPPPFLLHGSLP